MRQPPKPRTGSPTPRQSSQSSSQVHVPARQQRPSAPRRSSQTGHSQERSNKESTSPHTSDRHTVVDKRPRGGQKNAQTAPRQQPQSQRVSLRSAQETSGEKLRPTRSKLLARPLGGTDAARVLGSDQAEDAAENFSKRQRERKRARRRLTATRSGIVVGVVVAILAVAWVIGFSSLFALSADGVHVTIQTTSAVSQSGAGNEQSGAQSGLQTSQESVQVALTSAQRSQLETQVEQIVQSWVGKPLLRISPEEIVAQLVSIPRIQSAQVHRSLPGALEVSVTPRLAALNVHVGSQYQVLGDDGVLVEVRDSPIAGLPLATIPESGSQRATAAQQVADIWGALTPDLRARVGSISGNGVTNTLTVDSTRTVVWGDAENSDLKARVAQILLSQTNASSIDVSVPERPVTSNS